MKRLTRLKKLAGIVDISPFNNIIRNVIDDVMSIVVSARNIHGLEILVNRLASLPPERQIFNEYSIKVQLDTKDKETQKFVPSGTRDVKFTVSLVAGVGIGAFGATSFSTKSNSGEILLFVDSMLERCLEIFDLEEKRKRNDRSFRLNPMNVDFYALLSMFEYLVSSVFVHEFTHIIEMSKHYKETPANEAQFSKEIGNYIINLAMSKSNPEEYLEKHQDQIIRKLLQQQFVISYMGRNGTAIQNMVFFLRFILKKATMRIASMPTPWDTQRSYEKRVNDLGRRQNKQYLESSEESPAFINQILHELRHPANQDFYKKMMNGEITFEEFLQSSLFYCEIINEMGPSGQGRLHKWLASELIPQGRPKMKPKDQ